MAEEIRPTGEGQVEGAPEGPPPPLDPLPYAGAAGTGDEGDRALAGAAPEEGAPGPGAPSELSGSSGSPLHRLSAPVPPQPGAPAAFEMAGVRNIPDLTDPGARAPSSVVARTPDEEEGRRIREVVTREDLTRLMQVVTELYGRVEQELASSGVQAARALGWLNEARTLLMARPEQYPLAELRVYQTRTLLRQVASSRSAAERDVGRLAGWTLLWLLLFTLLLLFDSFLARLLLARGAGPLLPNAAELPLLPSLSWIFHPWLCILAGGIGGATAALFALRRQVNRREYDPASRLDYYLHPVTGAILGGLMYYVLLGGFLTAEATTMLDTEITHPLRQIQVAGSPLFIFVAFLAGAAQQRVLSLLGQLWERVTGTEREEPAGADEEVPVAAEPPPTPPVAQEEMVEPSPLPPEEEPPPPLPPEEEPPHEPLPPRSGE